jgi:hypothetical protein
LRRRGIFGGAGRPLHPKRRSLSREQPPPNTGNVLTFHFLLGPSPLFTNIVDQELLSLTASWMESRTRRSENKACGLFLMENWSLRQPISEFLECIVSKQSSVRSNGRTRHQQTLVRPSESYAENLRVHRSSDCQKPIAPRGINRRFPQLQDSGTVMGP